MALRGETDLHQAFLRLKRYHGRSKEPFKVTVSTETKASEEIAQNFNRQHHPYAKCKAIDSPFSGPGFGIACPGQNPP